MKLTKRSDDVSVMDRPWKAVDRIFDEMWRDPFRNFFRTPSLFEMGDSALLPWHPTADIEETNDAFLIRLDLPGIDKKDVHVNIGNNILTIRGERKREGSEKEDNYRIMERFYGKFDRAFVLPKGVDDNSINAEFKNGVLTISIRKSEKDKPKEIAID